MADRALPEESETAAAFVDKLVKLFSLSSGRMIVAPGNHDVNWDLSEDAFQFRAAPPTAGSFFGWSRESRSGGPGPGWPTPDMERRTGPSRTRPSG